MMTAPGQREKRNLSACLTRVRCGWMLFSNLFSSPNRRLFLNFSARSSPKGSSKIREGEERNPPHIPSSHFLYQMKQVPGEERKLSVPLFRMILRPTSRHAPLSTPSRLLKPLHYCSDRQDETRPTDSRLDGNDMMSAETNREPSIQK